MKVSGKRRAAPRAPRLPWTCGAGMRLVRGSGLLLMVWVLTGALADAQTGGGSVDCTECHVCDRPSKLEPCLESGLCARHAAMEGLSPEMGPQVVILNELENVYGPARFDHAGHAHMATMDDGCRVCHHFTPPTADHPACKSCHPKEIAPADISQPGLRSAYHRSCMGCHQDWDEETACEVCHLKKVDGQPSAPLEGRHYPPIELPGMIVYTIEDEDDVVPFHHGNHAEYYEPDCAGCHLGQSCELCHVRGAQRHPMGPPSERDLHSLCFECHDEDSCEDCHGLDPAEVESAGD